MIRTEEVQLPQGTIRYRELGEGPPLVFVHGYLVDSRLWDKAAQELSSGHRCILPDWPMGSHVLPMGPDADLSPYGFADLIDGFLAALDLDDVTIVGNDSGGAMCQVLATRRPERIGRLVLTNCDTYDQFPPGIFKLLPPLVKLPGAQAVASIPFRIGALRRASFAPFAKKKIDPALIDSWFASQADAAIRRDTVKYTVDMNKRYTLEAAAKLTGFDRPTLIAWGADDSVFKLENAQRLARTIPDARLETIPDAKTFVSLDQPQRLAELIGAFVAEGAGSPAAKT